MTFLAWLLNVLMLFGVLVSLAWLYGRFVRFIAWLFLDREGEYLAIRGPEIRCDHNLIEQTERGVKCLKCSLEIDV